MTVRELYDYSISHSLLDQQIDDVLAIYYNKETSLNKYNLADLSILL